MGKTAQPERQRSREDEENRGKIAEGGDRSATQEGSHKIMTSGLGLPQKIKAVL